MEIDSQYLPLDRSTTFMKKVLDGVRDLFLVLARDGRCLHVSQACVALLDLSPDALIGKHITSFMHYDDLFVFLKEFKASTESGNTWRFHHRLRRKDESFGIFESTFRPYVEDSITKVANLAAMPMCVMASRPYSAPTTALMDSFLEHTITNVQLNQLLPDEDGDFYESDIMTTSSSVSHWQTTDTATAAIETQNNTTTDPDLKTLSVDVSAKQYPDGSGEIQTTFSSPPSTIPTADSVVGDVGIEVTASRLQFVQATGLWVSKPRTKKRKEDPPPKSYLCRDCGTAESSEWRKGPHGPKTLCNACGLRWSKGNKVTIPSE